MASISEDFKIQLSGISAHPDGSQLIRICGVLLYKTKDGVQIGIIAPVLP
jgi:hypothetical protein